MPQAIAAIIHLEGTEPDEGTTAAKRYNHIDYEQINHSYGYAAHYHAGQANRRGHRA